MDKLRALHHLLKVSDTLSFSRAAQAFGVPASSISRRIAGLEAELAWNCCTARREPCGSPKSAPCTWNWSAGASRN